MINTEKTLLARLQWPTPPENKVDATQHKRVLTAARRCLHLSAPITLWGTGFQLLREANLPEVIHCLDSLLAEIDFGCDDILVLMQAPERNEMTEKLYQQTEAQITQAIVDELRKIAPKIAESKLTSRLFNPAYTALDIAASHSDPRSYVKIRAVLDKVATFEHDKRREDGMKLTLKAAAAIERTI